MYWRKILFLRYCFCFGEVKYTGSILSIITYRGDFTWPILFHYEALTYACQHFTQEPRQSRAICNYSRNWVFESVWIFWITCFTPAQLTVTKCFYISLCMFFLHVEKLNLNLPPSRRKLVFDFIYWLQSKILVFL